MEHFFARLPEYLQPDEVQLRELLVSAAEVAGSYLPPDVPLQAWVERRIPDAVRFDTDTGWVQLLSPAASPSPVDVESFEAFFENLPTEDFLPAEEALRTRLLEVVRPGSPLDLPFDDAEVLRRARALLPESVGLEEWIERRIGEELALEPVAHSSRRVCFRLPEGELEREDKQVEADQRSGEFAAQEELTEAEEQLRDALMRTVSKKPECRYSKVANLKYVREAKLALEHERQEAIDLKEWIEARIQQLEVYSDHGCVKLRDRVVGREWRKKVELENRAKRQSERDFLAGLPRRGLTAEEETMRCAVLDVVHRRSHRDGEGPMMEKVSHDAGVIAAKGQLFGDLKIPLRQWIEQRLSNEVEVCRTPSGGTFLVLRRRDKRPRRVRSPSRRCSQRVHSPGP